MEFRELSDVRFLSLILSFFICGKVILISKLPNKSPNFNQFIKDYDETIPDSFHSRQFVFSRSHLRFSIRGVFPSALPRKGGGDSWIDSIFI